jgi:two-component system sensor histidine kinase VicK
MEPRQATIDQHSTNDSHWGLRRHPALVASQTSDERRRELEAILRSVPEPIVVVDRVAYPLIVSEGYDQLVRAAGGVLRFLDQAGEVVPPAATPLRRAARGESVDLELSLRGPDEEQHLYQILVRPIDPPQAGEAVGIVTFRDLGERQLRLRQERFLALVAHELRAPLSGIRGYVELLTSYFQDDLPDDHVQAVAKRLRRLTERLNLMIGELLDVDRISGRKHTVRRTVSDLREVVRSAAEIVRLRPDSPPIQVELPAVAAMAEVDPHRLGDVILNLLTNAVNHATGATHIETRLTVRSNGVEIEVEDDGQGIPPDDLPHIFNRHYQVLRDDAHGRAGDGLGLGLFIAQQTVEAHGGHLDVESTPGVGTRFTIRLPRR